MRGHLRVVMLHNPTAGAGDIAGADLRKRFSLPAVRLRYHSLKDSGWTEALGDGADLVIAAGGDGAVSKVARAMLVAGIALRVPLAILPLGTANNIARSLALTTDPGEAVEELIAALDCSPPAIAERPFDALSVSFGSGEQIALESVGAGLLARVLRFLQREENVEVVADTARHGGYDPTDDHLLGALAWRRVLAESSAEDYQVALDGSSYDGNYIFAAALNAPSIGPWLSFSPTTSPSDGRVDVALVGESDRDRLDSLLEKIIVQHASAGHVHVEPHPPFTVVRATHVAITAPARDCHTDDALLFPEAPEDAPRAELRIAVRPSSLRIWIPASARR
jgi:diacylglycerol kinase (ATP)